MRNALSGHARRPLIQCHWEVWQPGELLLELRRHGLRRVRAPGVAGRAVRPPRGQSSLLPRGEFALGLNRAGRGGRPSRRRHVTHSDVGRSYACDGSVDAWAWGGGYDERGRRRDVVMLVGE
uniref:Uncharacterized protein n=1 Tax=Knipowitschia caucasica TaxID=637954 RepID=A0AAV2LI10_KNICA